MMNIIKYVLISISAWTGAIDAEHLYDPPEHPRQGWTSNIWRLEDALPDLIEGGFVVDKRPLAEEPAYPRWVYDAPLCTGRLSGSIKRCSTEARQAAAQMGPWMEGEFRRVAAEMAESSDPADGSPGPFDVVPADLLAEYWRVKGARIGRRVGQQIQWSDGAIDPIEKGGAHEH